MTLCGGPGGTLTSGGGTPDRGCGMPFRPVPTEFNCCPIVVYFCSGEVRLKLKAE